MVFQLFSHPWQQNIEKCDEGTKKKAMFQQYFSAIEASSDT
jgi:hypothetical protein